jgi:RNA polymerase sigma-70 factor (ECF subfamily)
MMAAAEEAAALHAAMSRLSEDYREVLHLRNWQQLPFMDIGEKMGRSAEAARKLWSRALVQLQQELNAYVGQDRSSRD